MFFVASKVFALVLMPSSLITLLIIIGGGLVLKGRWPTAGRRMLGTGLAGLLACSCCPLDSWLLLPLEQRFPRPTLPQQTAGIIILGGFETVSLSRTRNELSLNAAAERLTEGLVLAHRMPAARIIFTGGDGTMLQSEGSAASNVGAYLRSVGIEAGRIVLEDKSRSTAENGEFLARLLQPKPGERYILVTSAFHMARSVAVFRRHGFEVIAWPVDYRTSGPADAWQFGRPDIGGLERVDTAFKEWIGLLAYRISGRTASLWPAP